MSGKLTINHSESHGLRDGSWPDTRRLGRRTEHCELLDRLESVGAVALVLEEQGEELERPRPQREGDVTDERLRQPRDEVEELIREL